MSLFKIDKYLKYLKYNVYPILMFKYHVTKFFIDENNQVSSYPTEILDSLNQVLDYAQDFFNNKKIYSTREEGMNESYIKCVGDDSKIIRLSTKIQLLQK